MAGRLFFGMTAVVLLELIRIEISNLLPNCSIFLVYVIGEFFNGCFIAFSTSSFVAGLSPDIEDAY
jgi:hypothetical protein